MLRSCWHSRVDTLATTMTGMAPTRARAPSGGRVRYGRSDARDRRTGDGVGTVSEAGTTHKTRSMDRGATTNGERRLEAIKEGKWRR